MRDMQGVWRGTSELTVENGYNLFGEVVWMVCFRVGDVHALSGA